jgi:hypothetical protein
MPDTKGIGTFVTDEHELATDGIDLFGVPQAEVSIVHGKNITIYPSGPITDDGNFEFILPNDSNEYTMLHRTTIYGEVEVLKKDGTALVAGTDSVSCVNNFPQALFQQISVYLNGQQINDLSTQTYGFKAFIESHLTYDTNIKETTLAATEMYIKDKVGEETNFATAIAKGASGMKKRSDKITGKRVYFDIVPHVDFLQSTKFLLPGVEMIVKLKQNSPDFCLIHNGAAGDYIVKVHKLHMCTRRVTLDPRVASTLESRLAKTPSIYPVTQSKIKTHLLPAGTQTTYLSQVVRGKLPSRFMFCLMESDRAEAIPANNPFYFNHCDLNYLNVLINGEPIFAIPIDPDWTAGTYLKEYRWFLDNIGLKNHLTNGITMEEFASNSCFFAFDLSPDQCNGYYKHGLETGNIDIQVGFKAALAKNHTLMLYASYDEQVLIDKNRVVTLVA